LADFTTVKLYNSKFTVVKSAKGVKVRRKVKKSVKVVKLVNHQGPAGPTPFLTKRMKWTKIGQQTQMPILQPVQAHAKGVQQMQSCQCSNG
jgi:hypothetical protein